MRRALHLFRKSENEKYVWITMGVIFVVSLVVIGIWQFVVQEYMIREQERSDDYLESYEPGIPSASDEPLMSTLNPSTLEQEESASE